MKRRTQRRAKHEGGNIAGDLGRKGTLSTQRETSPGALFSLRSLSYCASASGHAQRWPEDDVARKQSSQLREHQNDIAQSQGKGEDL